MIVAAFISDRRDLYLPECQRTFWNNVPHGIIKYYNVIDDRAHELGMAGAVQKAWRWATEIGAHFLVHVEEDFVFTQPLPIGSMRYLLEQTPRLAQIVLKRQPWSAEEIAAGGQIETNPDAYKQHRAMSLDGNELAAWVEHETLFSLNPCLIPRRVFSTIDPTGHPGGAERAITDQCVEQGLRFAYYGHISDPPFCTHVGAQRATTGWRW